VAIKGIWHTGIGPSVSLVHETVICAFNACRHRVLSDSHDIEHSPIFNADPAVGLGTFPNASTNFTLYDGAFRDIIRAYPVAHHIQRNYSLRVRFCRLIGV
jgi:hypothetical protein